MNTTTHLMEVRALSKAFGGVKAVDDVSFEVAQGDRMVILGPNGAGKSSLLNLLAGEMRASSGQVWLEGKDITAVDGRSRVDQGVRRSFQHSQLMPDLTVAQHLALALAACGGQHWSLLHALGAVRQRDVQDLASRCGISMLLPRLAKALSHGERRQLELAIAMAGDARLLLLDEPAAGLSQGERIWLKSWIQQLDGSTSLILIEHDMDVALSVANRVLVMHNGKLIFAGTPVDVVRDARVQEIYLGADHAHGH